MGKKYTKLFITPVRLYFDIVILIFSLFLVSRNTRKQTKKIKWQVGTKSRPILI